MRVGYIGLGVMGHSMAGHLLRRFGALAVWNRTTARADELVAAGAVRAATPAALAAVCDAVCLCVSDTPDVESVVFGADGVYTGLQPDSMVIDFSSISPARTREFADRLQDKHCQWIDAPVTGGDIGARNATLTIMAGGEAAAIERARPVFEAVGKKLNHMGPVGCGQMTKLANQIAVAGTLASMGEALTFAQQSGLDPAAVMEAISSGAAGSWSLTNYGPRVLRGDLAPGFAASLMAKDMRLVLDAISAMEGDFTTLRHMAGIFEKMVEAGEGGRGVHASATHIGWKPDNNG